MRSQKLAVSLGVALMLMGCASSGGARSVQAGMSRQMTFATMGEPDDRIVGRNYSAYKWTQTDEQGGDFWAILQDDVVVATGFGTLEEDSAGNLTIVPLRR